MPLIHLIGTRKFAPETDAPLQQLEAYVDMADELGMSARPAFDESEIEIEIEIETASFLGEDMRTHAHFSLAQAQDQIAETCDKRRDGAGAAARYRDRAWAHVVEANERWFLLERADGAYDARKYARLVDRLIRGYPDAAALAAIQNPDATAGKQFVFFVGTPRCGSTLAERVVLASGAALPLGEIGTFPRMLRHLAGDLGAPASEAGGMFDAGRDVAARAGKGCEIPNFKGSYLGRFPLVLADFWTSDHLSERSRP